MLPNHSEVFFLFDHLILHLELYNFFERRDVGDCLSSVSRSAPAIYRQSSVEKPTSKNTSSIIRAKLRHTIINQLRTPGQHSNFSCAHLRTLHVVVVVYLEHGAYLVNTIIFVYKLALGCYLQVTIL